MKINGVHMRRVKFSKDGKCRGTIKVRGKSRRRVCMVRSTGKK